jgi:hypothetical protein
VRSLSQAAAVAFPVKNLFFALVDARSLPCGEPRALLRLTDRTKNFAAIIFLVATSCDQCAIAWWVDVVVVEGMKPLSPYRIARYVVTSSL